MITQEELKERLSYNELTGLFVWLKSNGSRAKIGDCAGSKNALGYIALQIDGKKYTAHRLAWLYIYGEFPSLDIDHIDENKSNNSINNLRDVNRSTNMLNINNPNNGNSSGFRGVYFVKRLKKFTAEVWKDGKKKRLGHYKTAEEASAAYLKEKALIYAG